MNKKKALIIIGSIVVVVAIVLSIFLIGGKNEEVSSPDTPTSTATPDEAQTEKEYEELKEKVKDIYEYVPIAPYSFDVEGEHHEVKDLTAFFTVFPSKNLQNKEGNAILYKEELYELKENIKDFNKPIFTDKEVKECLDNGGYYPEIQNYFEIDVPGYNFKQSDEYKDSFYNHTMYENSKNIYLISSDFASEDEYYQACYDVLLEIMNSRPKDISIMDCMVPMVSDACIDNLELSVEKGDYSLLFDAIMNETFAFIYTDENGIWNRIEYTDYRLQEDGSRNYALCITSKCTFDDETKFR